MAEGVPWGIFCGWTFRLEGILEGEGEECIDNPELCTKPLGDHYVEGDYLCMCVPCPVSDTSTYSWAKNGTLLANGGRIYGVNKRTLRIAFLETGDSGLYSCTYDDGSKSTQVFESQVTVVKKVPAMSALGIIALFAVCGTLGIYALYIVNINGNFRGQN
jgi:hypothetical protein